MEKGKGKGKAVLIFKRYVSLVIIYDFILFILTLIWFIWWNENEMIIIQLNFYLRLGNVIRMMLLIMVLMSKIDIYKIKGDGRINTILRNFARYKLLGGWVLIGIIDYYLIRIPLFIVDFIYYFIFLIQDDHSALAPFIYYFILNFLYLLESYLSIYLIYHKGIWMNIMNRIKKEQKLLKKEKQNEKDKKDANKKSLF